MQQGLSPPPALRPFTTKGNAPRATGRKSAPSPHNLIVLPPVAWYTGIIGILIAKGV